VHNAPCPLTSQLGLDTELVQLWGQSIDSERSKLKDEKFFSGENEQVQAEILSRILVRGSPKSQRPKTPELAAGELSSLLSC
jgi:hypothetical protein